MPNYKVRIELNGITHGMDGISFHAVEIYLEAPSILTAGKEAIELLADSISDNQVTRIFEIEPKPVSLGEMCSGNCGMLMRDVPHVRYPCRNNHLEFRRKHNVS